MLVNSVAPSIQKVCNYGIPQDIKGKKRYFLNSSFSEFFLIPQEMTQTLWLQESPITAFSL